MYTKEIKAAKEQLDKYDFTELLNYCYDNDLREIWDIIDKVIVTYPELDALDGAFDYLDHHEFMDYLNEKYNIRFEEVVKYRMWYK